jgi:hypothetical protein
MESKYNKSITKYFNKQKEIYEPKIKSNLQYDVTTYLENEAHVVKLSHNNNIVIKFEYELLGYYNAINSMWNWGWATELIDRSITLTSQKMQSLPEYIKNNIQDFDNKEAEDLHFKTSNPSFFIDFNNIDKLVKASINHLNSEWFIKVCSDKNGNMRTCDFIKNEEQDDMRIEYLLIKKILQQF